MPIFNYGGPPVDILDCKVATNNGDGTFGTAYDVPSVKLLSAKVETASAELTGDGQVTSTYTQRRSATLRLQHGGIPREAYQVMFGIQGYEYGVTPSRRYVRRVGPGSSPSFAIAAKAATGDDSSGCFVLFAPRCVVREAPDIQVQEGNFVIPDMTITALPDDNYLNEYGEGTLYEMIEYEASVSVTIPPVSYS